MSLADFRDCFPSKGAVLAGFSRRIDRAVLAQVAAELADESPRERLFDILMLRLEAMAPYREGVREAAAWLRRDPASALAMNQVVIGSMRFMLEAAGIEVEARRRDASSCRASRSPGRASSAWLDDDEPGLSKTMAELDRELTRGERAVAGVECLNDMATPFRASRARPRWPAAECANARAPARATRRRRLKPTTRPRPERRRWRSRGLGFTRRLGSNSLPSRRAFPKVNKAWRTIQS